MNEKKLPFSIARSTWGNLSITVDKVDDIKYSAGGWYCSAYTLSENYKDYGYGNDGEFKAIGCSGSYQWRFSDKTKVYNEELLPVTQKHHERGLKFQKAGKVYECYFCKNKINKGDQYERYSVRSAGDKNLRINEVFCIGHRDEMREKYFKKNRNDIKFQELIDVWNKGIII